MMHAWYKEAAHIYILCRQVMQLISPFFSSRPEQSILKELHSRGHEFQLEVLALREDWIEIVASAANNHMPMLQNCDAIASLPDLIEVELQGSWKTLKHHVSRTVWNLTDGDNFRADEGRQQQAHADHTGHTVLKRSAKEPNSDCREGVCSKDNAGGQPKEDEWFTYYVSM